MNFKLTLNLLFHKFLFCSTQKLTIFINLIICSQILGILFQYKFVLIENFIILLNSRFNLVELVNKVKVEFQLHIGWLQVTLQVPPMKTIYGVNLRSTGFEHSDWLKDLKGQSECLKFVQHKLTPSSFLIGLGPECQSHSKDKIVKPKVDRQSSMPKHFT